MLKCTGLVLWGCCMGEIANSPKGPGRKQQGLRIGGGLRGY